MRRYLGRTTLRLEPYWWPLAQGISKAWGATTKSGLIGTAARNSTGLWTRKRPTQGC